MHWKHFSNYGTRHRYTQIGNSASGKITVSWLVSADRCTSGEFHAALCAR